MRWNGTTSERDSRFTPTALQMVRHVVWITRRLYRRHIHPTIERIQFERDRQYVDSLRDRDHDRYAAAKFALCEKWGL